MILKADKKDLLHSLSKTQNVADRRNNSSIMQNVLLEVVGDTLKLYASDLEVSVFDSIKVKGQQDGALAVSAKNFYEIIRELNDGEITLAKQENNWLEIKQEKYRSRVVGVSRDDYPELSNLDQFKFHKVASATLREMIEKTSYCISNDETRYFLNGVYFEQTDAAGYVMVSTDGHRLTLINRPKDKNSENMADGVIIPKKGISELRKLLEGLDQDVEIAVDGSQMAVKIGPTALLLRLIEGRYPDYNNLIPKNHKEKIIIDRENFLTSLKRVSLLASFKSKAVTIGFSAGKMEISSNNPDLGDAKEEIDVEYSGPDLKVGYNAKYITEILSAIQNDRVVFEITDALSPSLIRPHDDKSYTCVVMPMRF